MIRFMQYTLFLLLIPGIVFGFTPDGFFISDEDMGPFGMIPEGSYIPCQKIGEFDGEYKVEYQYPIALTPQYGGHLIGSEGEIISRNIQTGYKTAFEKKTMWIKSSEYKSKEDVLKRLETMMGKIKRMSPFEELYLQIKE